MKRVLPLLFAAVALLSCRPALERGRWNDETYAALSALLADAGDGGYAVFDCDNTTVIHDVTHTMMVYQIENLRFAVAPEHCFLDGLGDVDFPLEGLGMTAREMGTVLAEEYAALKTEMNDSLFRDYRARFIAFYDAVGDNYSYGELCLWEPSLAAGFSPENLEALGRESLTYWLSQGRAWEEEWTSPDGRFSGIAKKGLVLTDEMKNLYASLSRAGITPYVCSASMEWLVELLCCDSALGLGLPPEQVFGIRFIDKEDGTWDYDASYPQPFKEGKVACIDELIAPLYEGREPVLVAGDSEGDVAMLTAYDGMKIGLVIDWDREGEIDDLASLGDGRYYSQKFPKD